MPRPGPLQELPLDQFLPPNPNLPSTSRKRPLSPGGPGFFSPAKRRILNEEGIFKSPVSGRGTPARFTEVLTGPSSPARKLDFGSPKATRRAAVETTPPCVASSSNRLAPSPHVKEDHEMEAYFIRPSSSSQPPSSNITPRETPPPQDPQSIHYPGFRVYFDTHVVLAPVEEPPATPSTPGGEKEKETLKENVVPRRRPRKPVIALDVGLKTQLFSPHAKERPLGKAKSTPMTPVTCDKADQCGSPTPRRFMAGQSSSTTRLTEMERKDMRRLLQDEADAGESV